MKTFARGTFVNSHDPFARLIYSVDGRQAWCIYDEDSLTIHNLSSANEWSLRGSKTRRRRIELDEPNRSRMLLVVHRGRARKHAVQKAPVTLSKHEVHWSTGNENIRPFLIVRVAMSRHTRLARRGIDIHSLVAPNASVFSLVNSVISIFTFKTIKL